MHSNILNRQCYQVSKLGSYVALANRGSPTTLVIHSLVEEANTLELPWDSEWIGCSFTWQSDTLLKIYEVTSGGTQFFLLDVTTGAITGPHSPDSGPQLPNLLPGHFQLASPNSSFYVYNQCESGQAVTGVLGDIFCSSGDFIVIYDTTLQETIEVLEDTDEDEVKYGGASWSPSGQYLAYLTVMTASTDPPDLRIYDVVSRQFLDTTASNNRSFIEFHGLGWSPDETKIAAWHFEEPGGPTLAVFDLLISDFNTIEQPYDPFAGVGFWSPDSQAVAFVERGGLLVQVELDETTSVLDDNVEYVVAWASLGEWNSAPRRQ